MSESAPSDLPLDPEPEPSEDQRSSEPSKEQDRETLLSTEHGLAQVEVTTFERNKQRATLYSNPLGKACYLLDHQQVVECVKRLKRKGLLEAGLVFASEVKPLSRERRLSTKERKVFRNEIGCPPIIMACVACAAKLVQIRQEQGISGDASRTEPEKDVQVAATEVVKVLVRHGARIAAADVGPNGGTALHVAARSGAPVLLSALLRLDADIQARDGEGCAPETLATRFGHVTCQQILMVTAMVEMEKVEPVLMELVKEEDQESKKAKDRRRKKRRRRRGGSAQSEGAGSGDSEASDGKNEVRSSRAESRTTKTGSETAEASSQAPYGKDGMWAKLDEDFYPDDWLEDANLPDEWDTAKWGEYEDWGLDWDEYEDEEEHRSKTGSETSSDDDDDAEVRAAIDRLRKEKVAQLTQLRNIALDREARLQEIAQGERQVKRLEERAQVLKEREERALEGDSKAAEDTGLEVEVSGFWESAATRHAVSVWEMEKKLVQQERAQKDEISAAEKEIRALRRRTKGLAEYWDLSFSWDKVVEMLGRMTAEKRANELAQALEHRTASLDISPELKEQLPLLVERVDDGVLFPETPDLLVALQVHRKIQATRRAFEEELNNMSDFCNKSLKAKNEEILMAVEHDLVHRSAPDGGNAAPDPSFWQELSELARHAREELHRHQRHSQADAQGPAYQLRPRA